MPGFFVPLFRMTGGDSGVPVRPGIGEGQTVQEERVSLNRGYCRPQDLEGRSAVIGDSELDFLPARLNCSGTSRSGESAGSIEWDWLEAQRKSPWATSTKSGLVLTRLSLFSAMLQ